MVEVEIKTMDAIRSPFSRPAVGAIRDPEPFELPAGDGKVATTPVVPDSDFCERRIMHASNG
jgi:hypothetical protein